MKALLSTLILLVSIGCKREISSPTEPVSSHVTALKVDSASVVQAEPVMATEGPKTLQVAGKKVKVKRGGTLIIQTAPATASVVQADKAKGPVGTQVASAAAELQQVQKPQNSAIASGDNSPASTTNKTSSNWYLWLGGGIGISLLVYLLLKIKVM